MSDQQSQCLRRRVTSVGGIPEPTDLIAILALLAQEHASAAMGEVAHLAGGLQGTKRHGRAALHSLSQSDPPPPKGGVAPSPRGWEASV